jgi:hypothetical protein
MADIMEELLDSFESKLCAAFLRAAIAAMERRIKSLESPQGETSAPANTKSEETGSKLVVETPTRKRRRPGRPRGKWSAKQREVYEARRQRGEQLLNSPEVRELTRAIWKSQGKEPPESITRMSGVSQDDGSENPKAL